MWPGWSRAALGALAALGLVAALPDSDASEELRQALVLIDILRSGMARHRAPATASSYHSATRLASPHGAPLRGHQPPFRRFYGARGGRQLQYEDSFGAHPDNQSEEEPGDQPDKNEDVTHDRAADQSSSTISKAATEVATAGPASRDPTSATTRVSTTTLGTSTITPATSATTLATSGPAVEHFAPTRPPRAASHAPKISKLNYMKNDKFRATAVEEKRKKSLQSGDHIEVRQAAEELRREVTAGQRSRWRLPGTTRVYLARSSALPRPLPENNAFCHASPHSALCRTFI